MIQENSIRDTVDVIKASIIILNDFGFPEQPNYTLLAATMQTLTAMEHQTYLQSMLELLESIDSSLYNINTAFCKEEDNIGDRIKEIANSIDPYRMATISEALIAIAENLADIKNKI